MHALFLPGHLPCSLPSTYTPYLQVLVFLTFITAAIAVGQLNDLSSEAEEYIDDSDENHDDFSEVPDTPNLVALSRAEGGFLIFLAFVVLAYEAIVIALRFINLSLINEHIVIFLVVVSQCTCVIESVHQRGNYVL